MTGSAALLLGDGEGAGDPAALAGGSGRAAAVHHRSAAVEVDGESAAVHPRVALDEADVADQGDDPTLEIVDPDIALRRLGRASNRDSAGGVDSAKLDSAAARISDGEPGRGEGELGLADDDVAGEDGAVGAVLHLDPVRRDVDRRVAVMALEGRRLARGGADGEGREEQSGDETLHSAHLSPPCSICKRGRPVRTTRRSGKLAVIAPAVNRPSRIRPSTPPPLTAL